VGINVEYRLAPEFSWPAGADDVRSAVAWIKKHGKTYGGNTDRIFLFGHSAGASHAAAYVFDRRLQPDTGHGVAGAILSSGRYSLVHDADDPSLTGGVMQYFGADPARYASRSVTTHVATSRIPVMLVVSEFDQRNLVATSGELFVELCKRDGGRCPRFVQLKYHNHLSSVRHFNTEDDYLGREIREWIVEGADRANAHVDPR
jgi:acetyl esterase/lipase